MTVAQLPHHVELRDGAIHAKAAICHNHAVAQVLAFL
jgi:hypothetical protein